MSQQLSCYRCGESLAALSLPLSRQDQCPGCSAELETVSGSDATVKKGESIPLTARITALADVYDALCSRRSYKDAMDEEETDTIISESAGTHFDPEIVEAFFQITDVLSAIRRKYQ